MRRVFVLQYSPGPGWDPGKSVSEQPLEAHGAYIFGLHCQNRLVLGGPFEDDSGGLAIIRASSDDDARAVAEADPAVRDGIFECRVRPFFRVNWDAFGTWRSPRVGEIVGVLARTPQVLAALLAGQPAEWFGTNEGPGTWNALQIVAHLIHGEETNWIPRARILFEEGGNRPFEPFVREPPPRDEPMSELLHEFTKARRSSIAALQEMNPADSDLSRTGTHPELGEVTLDQLLTTWMVHDLSHIRQIARVIAKHHGGAVGPWREFLSIVREEGRGR